MSEFKAISLYNKACDLIECNGSSDMIVDVLKSAIQYIEDSSLQNTLAEAYARLNVLMGQMIEWSDSHSALGFFEKAVGAFSECGEAHLQLARCIWKDASSEYELRKVEHHLRLAITNACDDEDTWQLAKKFLGRLLLTTSKEGSPRHSEAGNILIELGFKYTFSSLILGDINVNVPKPSRLSCRKSVRIQNDYVMACDNVLPPCMLTFMKRIFHVSSPFWSEHGYDSPSTGFFSYQIELPLYTSLSSHSSSVSSFERVIEHIWRATCSQMPHVRAARYAEWWAHSRPHSNGHLLHYDYVAPSASDALPVHPLATSILYVTADCGGPTLVSNETIKSPLTQRGWLIRPAENRLASFRGSQLHCVLPGSGVSSSREARRVTVMVAFYENNPRAPAFPVPPAAMSTHSRPLKKTKKEKCASSASGSGKGKEHTWPALFAEPISPLQSCTDKGDRKEGDATSTTATSSATATATATSKKKNRDSALCDGTSNQHVRDGDGSCVWCVREWLFEGCAPGSEAVLPVSQVYTALHPSPCTRQEKGKSSRRGMEKSNSTRKQRGGGISLLDDCMFAQFDALNSGLLLAENGVCSLNCGGTCEICNAKRAEEDV
jgi:hypothetical protein